MPHRSILTQNRAIALSLIKNMTPDDACIFGKKVSDSTLMHSVEIEHEVVDCGWPMAYSLNPEWVEG